MTPTTATLVALSSGALPSGVAVIRLSGAQAGTALSALCGSLPAPRSLVLRRLTDPRSARRLDRALVAFFPAPTSFTGEDCAEIHAHGSPAGVRAILAVLTSMPGLVLAGPGDFTRRAFENGKLDLTAIEGLGDLLAAETENQRRQALARLEGGMANKIARWRAELLAALVEIEAHLDFADEDDVPEILPPRFTRGLEILRADLVETLDGFARARIVREGFRVVLAGPPNAGKSRLLNALAGSDLAIVTDEAGTTRDTRDVAINLGGQLVVLTDTAGLRRTRSKAEAEGIRRTHRALENADLVLWLAAPDVPWQNPPAFAAPCWTVATKADLGRAPDDADLTLSAATGAGIADLISRLGAHMTSRIGPDEPGLASHMRDRDALSAANAHLERALALIGRPELCAEELRFAGTTLARLIGLIDTEAVLDRLFAGFCIGK